MVFTCYDQHPYPRCTLILKKSRIRLVECINYNHPQEAGSLATTAMIRRWIEVEAECVEEDLAEISYEAYRDSRTMKIMMIRIRTVRLMMITQTVAQYGRISLKG